MNLVIQYALAWFLTVFIESLIFLIFIRDNQLNVVFYSALINSFTLPIASYAYSNLSNNLILVEFPVFLTESGLIMLLFKIKYSKSIVMSLLANLATTLIGLQFFH